ncbi:hypothetical protein [Leptospira licerasiae]|uniref:hypothetical protein n=1 Tax=Leptospira licerasiae TaxID=447106 RepID=UPI0010844BEE|nr:hypothetical protein [Leptospira licerasiae]TGM88441.1 hypothetical protein EHR05_13220 [Leptospira licerasiae]
MLISHNVSCGLVLTGTDVGKEFLGLSEADKKDPEKQAAALLSVLGIVSSPYLLQFNPPVVNLQVGNSGPFTVSIKTPIPSEWTGDGESVLQVGLDYVNCPSASDDNPFNITFSGSSNYASLQRSVRFLGPGNCLINFTAIATSSDINLPEGMLIGILPVIVSSGAVVTASFPN